MIASNFIYQQVAYFELFVFLWTAKHRKDILFDKKKRFEQEDGAGFFIAFIHSL